MWPAEQKCCAIQLFERGSCSWTCRQLLSVSVWEADSIPDTPVRTQTLKHRRQILQRDQLCSVKSLLTHYSVSMSPSSFLFFLDKSGQLSDIQCFVSCQKEMSAPHPCFLISCPGSWLALPCIRKSDKNRPLARNSDKQASQLPHAIIIMFASAPASLPIASFSFPTATSIPPNHNQEILLSEKGPKSREI